MPNVLETKVQSSADGSGLIIKLLFAAIIASAGTLATVWLQSALNKQRLTAIDDKHIAALADIDRKYVEKSNGVIARLDALGSAFGQHVSDDSVYKLIIQREHLGFENFMRQLSDAHKDIRANTHEIDLIQQVCCHRINGEMK